MARKRLTQLTLNGEFQQEAPKDPRTQQIADHVAMVGFTDDVNFREKVRQVSLDGRTYFSVLDVLKHYGSEGSAKKPTKYWDDIKKKIEAQSDAVATESVATVRYHQFSGERQRQTPVATYEFFMRIAQVSQIKEWERLRQWMVSLAVEKIETAVETVINKDVNGTPLLKWERDYVAVQMGLGLTSLEALEALNERRQGRYEFRTLAMLFDRVLDEKPRYGEIVNHEYRTLLGKVAADLRALTQNKSVRDGLPAVTYGHLRLAESSLATILRSTAQMNHDELFDVIKRIFTRYRGMLEEVCSMARIDPITGETTMMLNSGNQHNKQQYLS